MIAHRESGSGVPIFPQFPPISILLHSSSLSFRRPLLVPGERNESIICTGHNHFPRVTV
uniref:Uncharacterized protein n=1 Tax=Anopheles albimanus TaxID=7167 RepID=A0A182FXV5_ANOAL